MTKTTYYLTAEEQERLVAGGWMKYPPKFQNTAVPPLNKSRMFGKVDRTPNPEPESPPGAKVAVPLATVIEIVMPKAPPPGAVA